LPDPGLTEKGVPNMADLNRTLHSYASEVQSLSESSTTSEASFYPAIRALLVPILKDLGLSTDVRINTRERRAGGGVDLPDIALYDGGGDFIVVCGEVKSPPEDLPDIAASTDRNDQIGRYLAQTGVVLLCNVRGFGLLTVAPGHTAPGPVPPSARHLEHMVELWPSESAFRLGRPFNRAMIPALIELIEMAVTCYAPIAEPETLARILAIQARRAKASLPENFTQAISTLAEDFGTALGIRFEGKEGEEFFRSSLVQTVFYGLFAGWLLWSRSKEDGQFSWRDLPEYLKIPFLGELIYEIQHPRRIAELGLTPYLDAAAETLDRVNKEHFFKRLRLPTLGDGSDPNADIATAIVYFYEPFLEAFDPDLKKQLGVWYTPPEIVRYQVRKLDRLLREELGCPAGFADSRVVVLDPCCGTGAYLIEVLHCIADTLRVEGVRAELGATLLEALSTRLLGFEILTAPFVIAHLQVYLLLAELGAAPDPRHRPRVYLTSALTGWEPGRQLHLNFPELQAERDAAQQVKTQAKIIVILGNPPYNRFIGAPLEEEQTLIDPYKGIQRDGNGRQVGQSALFSRWGIRKHLLDDLYIRFFRLAEERIGIRAEDGLVSFISNSSYLAGRSHPLMRESLLSNFHKIWVDHLHGNRLASERTPWGESCETVFNVEGGGPGIKVGTAVTTLLKKAVPHPGPARTVIGVRDFWGSAEKKRAALVASLDLPGWTPEEVEAAKDLPEGPREYEFFVSDADRRWKLALFDAAAGYEEWFSLDELFPTAYQGVNPNRGLEGSVIEMDRRILAGRMREYYSAAPFEELQRIHPELCRPRARYNPEEVRRRLQRESRFVEDAIVPYVVFPMDARHLYYETGGKLLNERRPELWENLRRNDFLITVPEPRRESESRPLFTRTLFDLHLHDRGSVGFPAEVRPNVGRDPLLERGGLAETGPRANLHEPLWEAVRTRWGLTGGLDGDDARRFVRALFRVCLAFGHAPEYQADHRDSLAQDWAHVPIPTDQNLFRELVDAGDRIATLLDPTASARDVIHEVLGNGAGSLAVLGRAGGGAVQESDLMVTVAHYGAARGGWRPLSSSEDPGGLSDMGDQAGELYINREIFFGNIPKRVWRFELGGYPVLKKWLGYREARRRTGKPLTLGEKDVFRDIVRRIAALLALGDRLDSLYRRAIQCSCTRSDILATER